MWAKEQVQGGKSGGVHGRKHHETLVDFLSAVGLISEILQTIGTSQMSKVPIWHFIKSKILDLIRDLTFGYNLFQQSY